MAYTASLASGPDGRKRRVSYFYERVYPLDETASGQTFELILKYQLQYKMEMCRPVFAVNSDLLKFHTPEYLQFLSSLRPITITDFRACAGGSISAAVKLNRNETDIAINWAGGMSSVKPDKASSFGFVNDVVLGILELLKNFKRVLYIDIGYERADGVEEAFYNTPRVMTVSFHTIFPKHAFTKLRRQ
ncbi:Histone deacetylase 6 [Cardamine amara subsp. amara]|uniref:Histone deacetylase 6 n=1 Tax=Cardamine amara subsp. amara TaxID=228776 RepID=A0ABD1BYF1_CARAN